MAERDHSWLLFSGSSHEELALELAQELKVKLGKRVIEVFPDGEIGAQILENVRGKDVFVLQSIARHPNHYLMELLILIDALKRASARSIVTVIPYYGYARQDRKEKSRVPITAKLVADLLEKAGVTRVLTMDLHAEQIQGFFDVPVDNLYARLLFVDVIRKMGIKDLVVVSPDVGRNKMASQFAEELKVDIAIIDKRRFSAEKVAAGALIGNVSGKNVALVDDICSTGGTLKMAAQVCKQAGAKSIYAFVSHGLFVGDALAGMDIDRIFVTNSIPQIDLGKRSKVTVVSVAPMFKKAIERILTAKSISSLFEN